MLDVQDLCVQFAGLKAVQDLSFSVKPGQIITLMGPNGAGKSTAFNAIGGMIRPTSGKVHFDGRDITGERPAKVAALGIRRTFQNNGILREMTVIENVLTGLELSTQSTFWGAVTGMPGSSRAERDAVRRARSALEQMGVPEIAERIAGDLSFGQQRLVEIARATVARARMIMLDEPAVGLSPGERVHLGSVLRELAANGMAVLMVEHVQDLVMAVSDEILVLNYGKKIAHCAPSEIRHNRDVLEVYLGRA
ncbi:ABC transporter family protein [Paraburkholderia xenovorans LB400]|jgi:branched-chain amino acid transport system ATP-binding protein|uniref:Amino acid/amide ABC transporter ATP-binding protein 1, HAAT family n=1 Tax=Paraburkholderia xenovorans (strain LB400) TaxID=266265 RepID=Q13LT5_PARXL|nr:ABC transporter ATP-binding protein [Paraburkholderia xenovorans]ABE34954.1 amino acid/amide ABC transporter ATP-binding protein 1, HAAT family [Paraburkholderia xenovorans LB400]AIP35705.1 ABC transporter family protein [Paraburkholderia xenovorans LB400]